MVSTLTQQGGELTMRALELGAFDFITKPQAGGMEDNKKVVKEAIAPIVRAFARSNEIKSLLKRKPFLSKAGMGKAKSSYPVQHINRITGREKASSEIVAIGVSTGGPKALARMIPKIPTDLGAPILIVQHMPPVFTQSLAKSLDAKCSMSVREAVDGEPVQPGEVLIAPGGKQMKVVAGGDGRSRVVRITDDPPENNCKPSVDYLFRSIAHHYIERATGVIMTGMGRDGFLGLKLMKRNGAKIIAQNEASCVVYGMPKEPVESGIADVVVPLDLIAKEISRTVK
jgi:two-component system chemotaxis response regulator CheB